VTPLVNSLPENTALRQPLKVAAIVVTDDALGTNTVSLTGPDAAFFSLVGSSIFLRNGVLLDFESKPRLTVGISVADKSLPASVPLAATFSLDITNVNEPPTRVTLVSPLTRLSQATSTKQPVRVAGISITDDALGSNKITLSGADAAFFSLQDGSLYVNAGVKLSARAKPTYKIIINVLDPTTASTSAAISTPFTLAIT